MSKALFFSFSEFRFAFISESSNDINNAPFSTTSFSLTYIFFIVAENFEAIYALFEA